MQWIKATDLSLTGYRVWAGHEVEGDGVGGVGGGVLQASLWDFVEAVRGGGHVLVHAVEEGVAARRFPRLSQFEARGIAVLPTPIHVLRVTGQRG